MTRRVLEEVSTSITLVFKIDLEDMTPGTESEATFATTHAIDLTTHARQVDPDLETDVRDVTTNIHLPICPHEIYNVEDVDAPYTLYLTPSVLLPLNKSREIL